MLQQRLLNTLTAGEDQVPLQRAKVTLGSGYPRP